MARQDEGQRHQTTNRDNNPPDPASQLLGELQIAKERFQYFPRRDAVRVSLLPSDAPPRRERYELVDRVKNRDGDLEYIIRRKDEHNDNRVPPKISELSLAITTQSNRFSNLSVSLYDIDKYISARAIERFENARYEHPHPDDLPQRAQTSSRSQSSERFSRQEQRKQIQKKPIGRLPKKLKIEGGKDTSKVIPSFGRKPGRPRKEPKKSQIENDTDELARREGDVNMVDSIELLGQDGGITRPLTLRPFHTSLTPKKAAKYGMMAPPSRASTSTSSRSTSQSQSHAQAQTPQRFKNTLDGASPSMRGRTRASRSSSSRSSVTRQIQLENGYTRNTRSATASVGPSNHTVPLVRQSPVQGGSGEEEEEEFEISHILSHDDSTGTRYFFVSWVGFPDDEGTWMTKGELQGAQEILSEYLRNLASLEEEVNRAVDG